jgi:hypothetical protein
MFLVSHCSDGRDLAVIILLLFLTGILDIIQGCKTHSADKSHSSQLLGSSPSPSSLGQHLLVYTLEYLVTILLSQIRLGYSEILEYS